MCVCALVPRIMNRTPVVILQHKRERRHPLGTVRLLRLALERVRVEVAYQESVPPLPLPEGTALLYPGPEARELDSLAPGERPGALVLLDGTWSQARRMFRESPWLQALPRVALLPAAPSRYRIRKEPRPRFLSTLEAAVLALRALEPDTPGLAELVGAFDRMIEAQVGFMPEERRPAKAPAWEA
jgi:hypothetical protein